MRSIVSGKLTESARNKQMEGRQIMYTIVIWIFKEIVFSTGRIDPELETNMKENIGKHKNVA